MHAIYVRFTPESRHSGGSRKTSANDPKPTLALPEEFDRWPLLTLQEKLVTIDANIVGHRRYITFQHLPRSLSLNLCSLEIAVRSANQSLIRLRQLNVLLFWLVGSAIRENSD